MHAAGTSAGPYLRQNKGQTSQKQGGSALAVRVAIGVFDETRFLVKHRWDVVI